MKLSRNLRSVLAAPLALAGALSAAGANAALIDFEGYAQANGAIRQIANGTAGFNWLGFHASNPGIVTNKPNGQNTGYHNGVVSGDEIGFTQYGYGAISSGSAFTLNSLYLASAYKNDRTLRITGTAGDKLLQSDVVLGIETPTFVLLDWVGLTKVEFQWLAGSNGTAIPGFPTGDQIVFDNITFNEPVSEVPLPAAAWLFGTGLIGLAGAIRRRRG